MLALAFSPDGKSIAVATSGSPPGSIVSGAISIFDVASGNPRWRALCHGNAVLAVAFSPDAKTVASGGNDSWLKVWDADTGMIRQQHEVPTILISTLSYSPNGEQLATGTEPSALTEFGYDVLVFDTSPTWRAATTFRGCKGKEWHLRSFSHRMETLLSFWRIGRDTEALETERPLKNGLQKPASYALSICGRIVVVAKPNPPKLYKRLP